MNIQETKWQEMEGETRFVGGKKSGKWGVHACHQSSLSVVLCLDNEEAAMLSGAELLLLLLLLLLLTNDHIRIGSIRMKK